MTKKVFNSLIAFFVLFYYGVALANNDPSWEDNIVMSIIEDNDNRYIFQSIIELSKSHKQGVFFSLSGVDKDLKCPFPEIKKGVRAQVEVWKFNNRNVKMLSHCVTSHDGSVIIFSNPMNVDGGKYIVKQFLNSPKYVSIKNGKMDLNVTAVGFSKIWNGYGGDAL